MALTGTPHVEQVVAPNPDHLIHTLAPVEQDRLAAIGHPVRRREFILGRWLARQLLATVAGCAPGDIHFALSRHGRPDPVLPDGAGNWRCSISHHRGHVAVAVAPGPVGLDLEGQDRRLPSPGVLAKVLHPEERALLEPLPDSDRQARFLDWWCLKEAVVKRDGTGVGHRMQGTRTSGLPASGPWPATLPTANGQRSAWLHRGNGLIMALVCDTPADLAASHLRWLAA